MREADGETTMLTPEGETRGFICGWCEQSTTDELICSQCGHEDPARPWLQRGKTIPLSEEREHLGGRPRLEPGQIRQRLRIAQKELGDNATNAQVAERLEISERTLARWQKLVG